MELLGFRDSSTCHTSKLLIHSEVVLESDTGKRRTLLLYLYALLSLNGLVESLGVSPTWH